MTEKSPADKYAQLRARNKDVLPGKLVRGVCEAHFVPERNSYGKAAVKQPIRAVVAELLFFNKEKERDARKEIYRRL